MENSRLENKQEMSAHSAPPPSHIPQMRCFSHRRKKVIVISSPPITKTPLNDPWGFESIHSEHPEGTMGF